MTGYRNLNPPPPATHYLRREDDGSTTVTALQIPTMAIRIRLDESFDIQGLKVRLFRTRGLARLIQPRLMLEVTASHYGRQSMGWNPQLRHRFPVELPGVYVFNWSRLVGYAPGQSRMPPNLSLLDRGVLI